MYKIIFLFLLAFITTTANAEKIKIGIVSALTGDDSPTGLDVKDAIIFADSIYGNDKYELIIEDDRCSGRNAVSIANKFTQIDKINYVIGFSCSAATLPAAPIYEKAHVISMVASASSPKISDAGDYMFRTTPNDADAGKVLGDYVGKNYKLIGVLSEESDYAQHLGGVFEETIKTNGGKVITENFLPNSFDLRSQLLKLKEKKVPALFINAQAEKTFAIILNQLKNISWKPALFGAYWPGSPALLSIAQNDLEGIIFVDTPSLKDILNDEGEKLMQTFYSQGGKIRSTEAMFATSIEAYRAIIETIESKEEPRNYLYSHKFHGIFGDYTFDRKGEIQGIGFVIKTISNGQVIRVEH